MTLHGPLYLTLNASLLKIFLRIFPEGNSLNLLFSLRGRHPSLLMNLILVEMTTLRESQSQVEFHCHSYLPAINLLPIVPRRRESLRPNLLANNLPSSRLRFNHNHSLNLSDLNPVSQIASLLRVLRPLILRWVVSGARKRVLQAPVVAEVIAKALLTRPRQVIRFI